jgi:hypothetical protein
MKNNNIEITGKGWLTLIDKAYTIANKLEYANIISINREHGMLKIKFAQVLDKHEQYVLDSVSYKLERDSVRTCEECGAYAIRRKDIEIIQALCTKCYTLKYNEFMESASPLVTIQEPQE